MQSVCILSSHVLSRFLQMTLIFYPFFSGGFHFEIHSMSGVAYSDFTKLAMWLPQSIFLLVLKSGHLTEPVNGTFLSSTCAQPSTWKWDLQNFISCKELKNVLSSVLLLALRT